MPQAKPASSASLPAPVTGVETDIIKTTIWEFLGSDTVIRSFGPDPEHLELHAEVSVDPEMKVHDCLGVLFVKIEREKIDLTVSVRGRRVFGKAKIAYRQGVVL